MESAAERMDEAQLAVGRIKSEVGKVIVGQKALVDRLLVGLFTKGHILLEGVPGLAKTTAVKALAATVEASFQRIQFTPDLLPADLAGAEVYEPSSGSFYVKKGPIFHNILLADEINRAPSKVQSALLEAMQERQATIGGQTFAMPDPFLVLATQNPIEQEGTYPLPEAQVDRFLLKLSVDYPSREEEKEIVRRAGVLDAPSASPVIEPGRINEIARLVEGVMMDERLVDYVVELVFTTRYPAERDLEAAPYIEYGASPRASIALVKASKAYAFLQGRSYVTPQDIKAIAPDVLRHRILLSFEAEADEVSVEDVIKSIFDAVEVP
ncbi:MAG: MoxR-like ATPase [Desulfovibrionales bacterium]|nr:MoxR-like ATPase [Desulfovibrionales bacterium]